MLMRASSSSLEGSLSFSNLYTPLVNIITHISEILINVRAIFLLVDYQDEFLFPPVRV